PVAPDPRLSYDLLEHRLDVRRWLLALQQVAVDLAEQEALLVGRLLPPHVRRLRQRLMVLQRLPDHAGLGVVAVADRLHLAFGDRVGSLSHPVLPKPRGARAEAPAPEIQPSVARESPDADVGAS